MSACCTGLYGDGCAFDPSRQIGYGLCYLIVLERRFEITQPRDLNPRRAVYKEAVNRKRSESPIGGMTAAAATVPFWRLV